jgi:hypothetical protein
VVNDSSIPRRNESLALRRALSEADDEKMLRIVAVVDEVSNPRVNQEILGRFRTRLASLKVARPLRFSRLLFMPLDPLIVEPRDWRPGAPAVPRSVLAPIASLVQGALGSEMAWFREALTGVKTDARQVITRAGERLWPRAAEILAGSRVPGDWPETHLPVSLYQPLALAIATVLRHASQLRCLTLDAEIGIVSSSEETLTEIMQNIATESATGSVMVASLILLQVPLAAPTLWRIVAATGTRAEKGVLQQVMTESVETVLADIECDSGMIDQIGRGGLSGTGANIERVTTLLRAIGNETSNVKHRSRLLAMNEKLRHTCLKRFADGITEELIAPLTLKAGALDAAGQTDLETCARDLRVLETAARTMGKPDIYDKLLARASDAVSAAAKAGTLTAVRKLRLIEILAGPEAAEAAQREAAPPPV